MTYFYDLLIQISSRMPFWMHAIGSKYTFGLLFQSFKKIIWSKVPASCWFHLGKRGYDVSVLSPTQQLCLNKQAETEEPLPKTTAQILIPKADALSKTE